MESKSVWRTTSTKSNSWMDGLSRIFEISRPNLVLRRCKAGINYSVPCFSTYQAASICIQLVLLILLLVLVVLWVLRKCRRSLALIWVKEQRIWNETKRRIKKTSTKTTTRGTSKRAEKNNYKWLSFLAIPWDGSETKRNEKQKTSHKWFIPGEFNSGCELSWAHKVDYNEFQLELRQPASLKWDNNNKGNLLIY